MTGRPIWATAATYVRIESDLARGPLPTRRSVLDVSARSGAATPSTVRLHGRRIRAMLALAAGRAASTLRRYVRAGQRDLALHRTRFGSLDLRTAGAVHGTALA